MNMKTNLSWTIASFGLLAISACGPSHSGGGGNGTPTPTPGVAPTVLSNVPVDASINVVRNTAISATFDEAMDPATVTAATFTLTLGGVAVPGTVTYINSKASFSPTAHLASNGTFTATVTTGMTSAPGVALAASHTWTFSTSNLLGTGFPVDLGTAGNYAILAKSAISTVPASVITGDLGLSPAAATFITGFSLTADSSNTFSTSPQVTGKLYAADYTPPTPARMTTAVGDMMTAFTDAAGRAPDATELGAGDVGGMTLVPGVYKWSSGLLIPTNLTLNGDANGVWIFEIAQDLTLSNATSVVLNGGALPKNIFWQVSGQVNLGTTSHFEGVILSQTAIALATGASINGRLLAQTAVSLDQSTVVQPAP